MLSLVLSGYFMLEEILETHPHLRFTRNWEVTPTSLMLLGQCEAYVKAISQSPILPSDHARLLNVSLVKGAMATTAIEGNTLSEADIEGILEGKHLPPSKEYQEREAANIIEAFNILLSEVVSENDPPLISPQLIRRFHSIIGKDLGEHFDALPGSFRNDNRIVGSYRTPGYQYVQTLMDDFCEWISREFHYTKGQEFYDVVIQAVVAHVFLEWIHPFGDGNGRTGRLLEFYILLRGGNPDIASHILSNHYNETRSEYYRQLSNARKNRSITSFLEYALLGLRDGLVQTLSVVQNSQFRIAWDKFVYDAFDKIKMSNKIVFKRRRDIMLAIPLSEPFDAEDLPLLTTKIARLYGSLSGRTIARDLSELLKMELLVKDGAMYKANTQALMLTGHLPQKRQK
jgi:Fic family protein